MGNLAAVNQVSLRFWGCSEVILKAEGSGLCDISGSICIVRVVNQEQGTCHAVQSVLHMNWADSDLRENPTPDVLKKGEVVTLARG